MNNEVYGYEELGPFNCQQCSGPIPATRRIRKSEYCSKKCRHESWERRNPIMPDHLPDSMSKGTKGALSEIVAAADLLRRGAEVFRSISPNCSADLIANLDGELLRVEVRTGQCRADGSVAFPRHKRDEGRLDVYAVVVPSNPNLPTLYFTPDGTPRDEPGS